MIYNWKVFDQVNENLNKARRVLRESGLTESDPNFVKLRALVPRNPGYLGKFCEWFFKEKVSYERIADLYSKISKTRLPKPIDQYKTPEEIIDEIIRSESDAAINQMVGAIPSRTRDFLKSISLDYCNKCDGDGVLRCEECDYGEKECPECSGDGTISCEKCKGEGEDKDGNDCPECDYGSIECKRCEGNCTLKCEKCEGTGELEGKCPCKESTGEWNRLISFLRLQKDNKDLIIDLFSKKGGRYMDHDEEEVIDDIITDIKKMVDMPSISQISQISKTDNKNITHLYEDDKILIVGVTFEGVVKYGSSFWCITQDRHTFNDYVFDDGLNLQCIIYFKNKIPLVDNESVMGVTVGYDGEITAAHWEDDSDAEYEAENYIKENLSEKILDCICKLYPDKINDSEHRFLVSKIYLPLIKKEGPFFDELIEDFFSEVSENGWEDNNSNYGYGIRRYDYRPFIADLKSELERTGKKINLSYLPQESIKMGILQYINYNKNWSYYDIAECFSDIENENRDKLCDYLYSNGFDFKKLSDEDYSTLPIKFIDIKDVKKIDWDVFFSSRSNQESDKILDKFMSSKKYLSLIQNDQFLTKMIIARALTLDKVDNIAPIIDVSMELLDHRLKMLIVKSSCSDEIKNKIVRSLVPKDLFNYYDISFRRK